MSQEDMAVAHILVAHNLAAALCMRAVVAHILVAHNLATALCMQAIVVEA